jgi:hypothetical protein
MTYVGFARGKKYTRMTCPKANGQKGMVNARIAVE